MSETKLTAAQKRAIREARKNMSRIQVPGTTLSTLNALRKKGFAEFDRMYFGWYLTPAGWAVEVGDE